jgi:N-formylglutamate amidohydrolase
MQVGNCPLVLIAGHGGKEEGVTIPIRTDKTAPGFVIKQDAFTSEFVSEVGIYIERYWSLIPFQVHLALHRKYVDVNRTREMGVETLSAAHAYDHFHRTVRRYVKLSIARYGGCLLLDIHGTSNTSFDICLGTGLWEATDSADGVYALRRRLNHVGYRCVVDLPRYSGGFTVLAHGAGAVPGAQALQMEISAPLRFNSEERQLLAEHLALIFRPHQAVVDIATPEPERTEAPLRELGESA